MIVGLVLREGGASLDAPADASSADYPARPEWFYLCLFQMLKYFPGNREIIGTMVIPSSLLFVLLILPLLDRIFPRKFAHFLACGFVFTVVGGAGFLTVQALLEDSRNTLFQEARKKADAARERAIQLAGSPEVGIPPDGASYIMRRDPLTHGRAVLERRCLGCHVHEGQGSGTHTASDLAGFGSRAWIRGLLENPAVAGVLRQGPQVRRDGRVEEGLEAEGRRRSTMSPTSSPRSPGSRPTRLPRSGSSSPGVSDHPGNAPFVKECGTCHIVDGLTEGGMRDAPNLFAWGSPQWTTRMIRKPGAANMYGYLDEEQKMPAFGLDQVSANDVDMVIRYLKGDYLKPVAAAVVAEKSPPGQPAAPAKAP